MDLKTIKEIVNSGAKDEIQEALIINTLANDEKVIPMILEILSSERKENKDLIMDINLELSRAHIYIDMRPESKAENKDCFNKGFIMDEIAKFYIKNKGKILHCFNRFN